MRILRGGGCLSPGLEVCTHALIYRIFRVMHFIPKKWTFVISFLLSLQKNYAFQNFISNSWNHKIAVGDPGSRRFCCPVLIYHRLFSVYCLINDQMSSFGSVVIYFNQIAVCAAGEAPISNFYVNVFVSGTSCENMSVHICCLWPKDCSPGHYTEKQKFLVSFYILPLVNNPSIWS